MKTAYLFPGKVLAFKEECVVTTLLGSCVAVALHDPESKVGGLNHYLLPEVMPGEVPNARYGSFAIPELISEMEKLGASTKNIQAKVYGGANVISGAKVGEGIGKRNIDLATETLKSLGIKIVDSHVGGEVARTIKLNTSTFNIIVNQANDGAKGGALADQKPVDVSGFRPLPTTKSVKVLIVDDSATVRNLFSSIFSKAGLEVVGAAADAYQARELLVSKKPDVITLDIEMPRMSGVQFLEKLMKHQPIPVVMVSSLGATGEAAMRSLELGAIEFVHKPSQFDPAVLRDLAESLVEKVKAASSVNVIKKLKEQAKAQAEAPVVVDEATTKRKKYTELKVVVVGGNSGSPDSIAKFVSQLASDTPPVVVACSTICNFLDAFIQKLKTTSKVTLSVAKDGDFLRMGTVYFLPGGAHGKIVNSGSGPSIKLDKASGLYASQLPSATVLFSSAAESFSAGVYSILFSGFGIDGVEGLEKVQAKGGATVVQHPEETTMPFAPQKAIELGVADEILKCDTIAKHLMDYRNQSVYK